MEYNISNSVIVYVIKNNLILYDCIQLGCCSKVLHGVILADPNFWTRWVLSTYYHSNKTVHQLQKEVKKNYFEKHYFAPFRDSLPLKITSANAPKITPKLNNILHLLRKYPEILKYQSWLITICVTVLETNHSCGPLDLAALDTMKLLSTSDTLHLYILQDYYERLAKLHYRWSSRKFGYCCKKLLKVINLKTLQVEEKNKKKKYDLDQIFYKVNKNITLTENECSNLILCISSQNTSQLNNQLIQAAIDLMLRDSSYKEYIGKCNTSKLCELNLDWLGDRLAIRFYEVLAMDPNGLRDFGSDMKVPKNLIAIFEKAYQDPYNLRHMAGLICELGGLPRLKSESKVDFVTEETKESGNDGRLEQNYLRMRRGDRLEKSKQFKHVIERLEGFFRCMKRDKKQFNSFGDPLISYLQSLYGILLSDSWRTAHTPEDEIIFLESFLKDEEDMKMLCKKFTPKIDLQLRIRKDNFKILMERLFTNNSIQKDYN